LTAIFPERIPSLQNVTTHFPAEISVPSKIHDAGGVMKDCFIEAPASIAAFSFLVAVLVGIERMPAGPRRQDLFYDIGHAFNAFGNGDDKLGHRYMSAAGEAATKLYGEKMWDLNRAWAGIGSWGA
jgi:hypothetical protein